MRWNFNSPRPDPKSGMGPLSECLGSYFTPPLLQPFISLLLLALLPPLLSYRFLPSGGLPLSNLLWFPLNTLP